MMRRVQSEPKLSRVRSEPRLSYASAVSASYLPARDPPVYKLSRTCKYGKYDVLQKTGIGVDRPASVAARVPGRGRPGFVTEIKSGDRTLSNECRERIRVAMQSRNLKELQQAYRGCFSDQLKEVCFVATREVKPLQKRIRRFHDEELEKAISNDDRKALENAIKNAESDDTIAVFLGEDVPPIMLSRPPKLTEAKLLLETILRNEKRAEATREAEPAPDFSKKNEVPEPPPQDERTEQGSSLKNQARGAVDDRGAMLTPVAQVNAKVEEVKKEIPQQTPKQKVQDQGSSSEMANMPTLPPASPSPSEASSKSEKRKSRKSRNTVNEEPANEPAYGSWNGFFKESDDSPPKPTLPADEAPASPSPSEASTKSEKRKSRKSRKTVDEEAPVVAAVEPTPPAQNAAESTPKAKKNATPQPTEAKETATPTPRLEISTPVPARTTTVAFAEDVVQGGPVATPPAATPPAVPPPAASSTLEAMQERLAAAKSKSAPNLEEVKARLAAAKAKAAAAKAQAELASSGQQS